MPLLKENVITAKKMSLQQISLLQENVTSQIVINTRKCHCNKMALLQEVFLYYNIISQLN